MNMRQLVKCDNEQCGKLVKKYGGGFVAEVNKKNGEKEKVVICRNCAKEAGYKLR